MNSGNFNMDTHAKGITNGASSHSHESVHIRAPSTPQEKLFSMEEAQSCASIVSVVDGVTQLQEVLQPKNGHISELLHIPVTGKGTAPTQEGKIPTLVSLYQLIVRHSSAINHSESQVSHTQPEHSCDSNL